jgi:outer membrane receptor protein involved in Fe transport
VRAGRALAGAFTICLAATPVEAADSVSFDIPAGPLTAALVALAEQARLTIVANDPRLAGRRVGPVRGRMPVRRALDRLLAGSGFRFEFVGLAAVRIEPAPRSPTRPPTEARRAPPAPPQQLSAPAPQSPLADIVVTATKQGIALDELAGTARLVELTPQEARRMGAAGSEATLARLPMLASTSLGPGRDKLYIRGVADSSFNGPSQSIVGQYLGDVRLTFNAPDPDLRLYDVRRVELLEGPQGTLYGSGSLGGILRVVPNPPDPSAWHGEISAGLAAMQDGDVGEDLAAVVNAPLQPGRLTLRAVGYHVLQPGYIDDLGRGAKDVNRTTIDGGRATLLYTPGDWQIELGGVVQFISGQDGQYAERGLPPLTHSTHFPQPFDNDYLLGELTVRRRWGPLELVSSTGLVSHALNSQFDATGSGGTQRLRLYTEDVRISLLSNETRLSRISRNGKGWVVGWSLIHDWSRIERNIGPPEAMVPITGVRNVVNEAAVYGRVGFDLGSGLIASIGGRLTVSQSIGNPLNSRKRDGSEHSRTDGRATPSFALSWRADPALLVYMRYEGGFRAGGLAIAASGVSTAAQRYSSDELDSAELGFRAGREGDALAMDLVLSATRWSDIQADLIDRRGLPYTTNIGRGRIYGAEARAMWRPLDSLRIEAAAFLADSALSHPAPDFLAADERSLPNIAEAGARAAARYETRIGRGARLTVDGSLRYVGRSQLGIGPPLDIPQGKYMEAALGGHLDLGRFGVSLDISNLGNVVGNRFSYGNPFTVFQRRQITPVTPRTIRIALDANF